MHFKLNQKFIHLEVLLRKKKRQSILAVNVETETINTYITRPWKFYEDISLALKNVIRFFFYCLVVFKFCVTHKDVIAIKWKRIQKFIGTDYHVDYINLIVRC